MSVVVRIRKGTFQDSIERVLLDVIDLNDQKSLFLVLNYHHLRYLLSHKHTALVFLWLMIHHL
jgi:hypothetical protein